MIFCVWDDNRKFSKKYSAWKKIHLKVDTILFIINFKSVIYIRALYDEAMYWSVYRMSVNSLELWSPQSWMMKCTFPHRPGRLFWRRAEENEGSVGFTGAGGHRQNPGCLLHPGRPQGLWGGILLGGQPQEVPQE